MVNEDRARIMETNKSIRTIKNVRRPVSIRPPPTLRPPSFPLPCRSRTPLTVATQQELESLLEKGVLSEAAFDAVHAQLPAELPLSGGAPAAPPRKTPNNALAALSLAAEPASHAAPPPSYAATGPPALPARSQPPAAPGKPVLAHARALYRYAASDARDVSLDKDDRVAVYEYMNADWWMGRNERTGQEGIFPKSYVQPEEEKKTAGYQPPPPPQSNPYNSSVPPMAIADQGSGNGGGKGGEYGKKFGKKLGNAAVFGAGATLGGKIVSSIF